MRKINFHKLLMPSVLDGSKWMTRRVAYNGDVTNPNSGFYTDGKDKGKLALCDGEHIVAKSRYAVGEVVAIAQPYKDIIRAGVDISEAEVRQLKNMPGWINKLFVRADLMPSRIQFTDIKVERLQDISFSDCLKEGVEECRISGYENGHYQHFFRTPNVSLYEFDNPFTAFQSILWHCCKPKTLWDDNPWVFCYQYKRVK